MLSIMLGPIGTGKRAAKWTLRQWEVSAITRPLTVDEYDQLSEHGTTGENDHVELWDGTVVPTNPRNPRHRVGTTKTAEALE